MRLLGVEWRFIRGALRPWFARENTVAGGTKFLPIALIFFVGARPHFFPLALQFFCSLHCFTAILVLSQCLSEPDKLLLPLGVLLTHAAA